MTSWADQWDTGADPSPRRGSGSSGDGKKQGGDRVEKTKAAAATGLKKVKAGTAQGFQWIKDKYHQKKNAGKSSKQQGGGSQIAAGY
ncbi:uncharacterized protein LOC124674766 [Lolium rigidum]|uniref:uncharacterized protein LOC124674766 n=1 Tax=Lolium rigidum TaxID=89674 RepID=UPI001F5C1C6A|nr:uncharacterized protein LOC124674766 [Lolium rigidum]